jgi:hypothetical protein
MISVMPPVNRQVVHDTPVTGDFSGPPAMRKSCAMQSGVSIQTRLASKKRKYENRTSILPILF